ncbi:MAG: nuclear transport factor 2 family protein [Candidatus Acidiferrales bacterium]
MPRRLIGAHICFLSLVLAAAATGQANRPKADSDAATAQALQVTEQEWLKAEKNHDAAAFENIVADDWIAINPDGKSQTKAERSVEIKMSNIDSATLGDVKVRVFGDTAVVTGTDDEVTMKDDGKKSSDHYVWTDVFVKRDGKWLAVASQTAQIK